VKTVAVPTDSSSEPDYRMSLAAERTYLAFVRTALALMAAGVAIVGALPQAGAVNVRRAAGALLVMLGLGLAGMARRRWQVVDAAMRRGLPLPRTRLADVMSVSLGIAAFLALFVVVVSRTG
jgi:putative membrane protein